MLASCGVVGAVVGTLLLVNVPETPLVIAVVVAIVGYIVLFFAHPDRRTTPAQSRRWSPLVGGVAGLFQGGVGISGPIVGSWIHSYRLSRGAHIVSVTSLFLITGFTQLVILVASGELSGSTDVLVLRVIGGGGTKAAPEQPRCARVATSARPRIPPSCARDPLLRLVLRNSRRSLLVGFEALLFPGRLDITKTSHGVDVREAPWPTPTLSSG